jgi:hypothetical protein
MKSLTSRLYSVLLIVPGVGITLALTITPAHAGNQCATAKLKATGTAINALLQCHAKAVGEGTPVDAACEQRARTHLTTAFANAESTDTCRVSGEVATLQGQIDALVTEIAADLGGPGPSQCTQQRLRAAGKKALMLHNCIATAAGEKGPGFDIDHKCLERAENQFINAFFRAERKGDCIAGNVNDIEAQIEVGLVESRYALAPPVLTCEPLEITATHGAGPFWDNIQLAKIEDGKVPCAHIEEAKAARCVFSTASGSESGDWVETSQGNYARTGQALSLQGAPGGEYVIGARASEEGTMPCINPAGADAVAAPSAIPLGGGCTPETLLSARNTTGFLLENYATREVCTSSFPHPDDRVEGGQAVPTRTDGCSHAPPDVYCAFCFTGKGAALNDRGGRERDINGVYLPENRHCHMGVLGNLTFPVAKRPGMKFENGVLVVDDTTPIVWRPVSPVPNIAN